MSLPKEARKPWFPLGKDLEHTLSSLREERDRGRLDNSAYDTAILIASLAHERITAAWTGMWASVVVTVVMAGGMLALYLGRLSTLKELCK